MVKKLRLNIDYNQEYVVIGIPCHLKYYRIAYLINKKLSLHLMKIEDLVILSKKKQYPKFVIYYYKDEENFNSFYLISNKSQNGNLIPEQKQTDYFLFIDNFLNKQTKDKLIKEIREIPNVLTAYEINPLSIKDINKILSDLEIHITNIQKKKTS